MLLTFSIVIMIAALLCYSIGVWGEKFSGRLGRVNLIFFWTGFVFDTGGTTIMSVISGSFDFNFHGLTGLLAIALMLFHATWATIVLLKNQETLIKAFHRLSIIVWLIWLFPFVTGLAMNAF